MIIEMVKQEPKMTRHAKWKIYRPGKTQKFEQFTLRACAWMDMCENLGFCTFNFSCQFTKTT